MIRGDFLYSAAQIMRGIPILLPWISSEQMADVLCHRKDEQ